MKIPSQYRELLDFSNIKTKIPAESHASFLQFLYLQFAQDIRNLLLILLPLYLLFIMPSYFLIGDRFYIDAVGRVITCVLFVIAFVYVYPKKNIVWLDRLIAVFCVVGCLWWLLNIYLSQVFQIPAFLLSSIVFAFMANMLIKSNFTLCVVTTLIIAVSTVAVLFAKYDNNLHAIMVGLFSLTPFMMFALLYSWQGMQQNMRKFLYFMASEAEKTTLLNDNLSLKALSETDTLTNVSNRRAFEEKYNQLLFTDAKSQNHNLQMSIFIIDIDFFKRYNDHYGHFEGDKILSAVAHALKKLAESNHAHVFRFGGEEFVMVHHYLTLANAQAFAEQIPECISKLNIAHESRTDGVAHVTISVGGCVYDDTVHHTIIDMLSSADAKLYAVKQNGRNGVLL